MADPARLHVWQPRNSLPLGPSRPSSFASIPGALNQFHQLLTLISSVSDWVPVHSYSGRYTMDSVLLQDMHARTSRLAHASTILGRASLHSPASPICVGASSWMGRRGHHFPLTLSARRPDWRTNTRWVRGSPPRNASHPPTQQLSPRSTASRDRRRCRKDAVFVRAPEALESIRIRG
ncbi:hypothetical protein BV25DRAFT_1022946 [Artomyces pyxidatus]|uniref:Uncharacterized protein n=1 Tax=Artomyces pyxidatus TaxID=48021 RepID=A0ACB8STF6_9AGAM|nr:hypothetical protein BV25DRAFT_1022946 [Artomyces pyxidatus]